MATGLPRHPAAELAKNSDEFVTGAFRGSLKP
jgi:hypothetical protein